MIFILHKIFQRTIVYPIRWFYIRDSLTKSGNLEKLDEGLPTIIAANHIHKSDPFVILSSFSDKDLKKILPLKFMTANMYYFTLARPIMWLLGSFPAQTNKSNIPFGVNGAKEAIHKGYSFFIFPEGKRTDVPLPAKHGVFTIGSKFKHVQLVLVHISHTNVKNRVHYKIKYDVRQFTDFKSSQDILDSIYSLPLKS